MLTSSCAYDSYYSGLIEYWQDSGVAKLIIGLLHYANSGQPIELSPNSKVYIFSEINEDAPKTLQFTIYCRNGSCRIGFGYNWILIRRGNWSTELSEQSEKVLKNLNSHLEVAMVSSQKRQVKRFAFLNKVTVSMELPEKVADVSQIWHLKKAPRAQILLPICDQHQYHNFIEELLTLKRFDSRR